MSNRLDFLLKQNRLWSQSVKDRDHHFFRNLAAQQNPKYLWIGCADSRVPANEILGLLPGEVFVHRNVANVVVHTDLNCLSVLQYAVDALHVEHILVVGHYGCGGVTAAFHNTRLGLIDNWLRHVQDVRDKHRTRLMAIPDTARQLDRLCELNVLEQVLNLSETTIMHDAWARGQEVTLHGLIYGLEDGILHDLNMPVSTDDELLSYYEAAVDRLFAASERG
ncbi:MAG: carbonate dehydratase [Burkholderiales bacterium]|jgi:carbonic anhydrase|nr:carbonate dehydratase [Burkholderiales bacterium]